jgi:hypothetical protein
MMIMVLHPTKLTTLLTTVVCVFFVALALSFRMNKAEPKDILSATAAYAAVLVAERWTRRCNRRRGDRSNPALRVHLYYDGQSASVGSNQRTIPETAVSIVGAELTILKRYTNFRTQRHWSHKRIVTLLARTSTHGLRFSRRKSAV